MKYDVTILCQYFYPEYISSATLPYDTAVALSKSGLNVKVICGVPKEYSNRGSVPKKEKIDNITIERLSYLTLPRKSKIGRILNYFSFTFNVYLKKYKLSDCKICLVYSSPPILPFVAYQSKKKYGCRLVFVSYDVYPEIAIKTKSISENSTIRKVMDYVNTKVYKYVDYVVVLSTEMGSELLKTRDISENQIVVIENWHKRIKENDINRKSNEFTVGYFGNLGICQDIDIIIDSMIELKNHDVSFLIVGHGSKIENVRGAIKKSNLDKVVVLDFVTDKEYIKLMNSCDTLILSLKEEATGLAVPSKTYSYYATGKPIIALINEKTDIAKEIVEEQCGFVISNSSKNDLVEKILSLASSKELSKKYGENALRLYEKKYTTDKGTKKYVNLVKQILEEENV